MAQSQWPAGQPASQPPVTGSCVFVALALSASRKASRLNVQQLVGRPPVTASGPTLAEKSRRLGAIGVEGDTDISMCPPKGVRVATARTTTAAAVAISRGEQVSGKLQATTCCCHRPMSSLSIVGSVYTLTPWVDT